MHKTQVDRSLYFSNKYFTRERFASYYAQIKSIIKYEPESVLEIGVGDKTVSNYLKESGVNVTTFDYDYDLSPDVVGDLREGLDFQDNAFDVVSAFEVLEHLPYDEFLKHLKELSRVSRKNVIISIPYPCLSLESKFCFRVNRIPSLNIKILKEIYVPIIIPYFLKIVDFDKNGQHYWELGTRGYSKSRIRKDISKIYKIENEYHCYQSPGHYFFELEIL